MNPMVDSSSAYTKPPPPSSNCYVPPEKPWHYKHSPEKSMFPEIELPRLENPSFLRQPHSTDVDWRLKTKTYSEKIRTGLQVEVQQQWVFLLASSALGVFHSVLFKIPSMKWKWYHFLRRIYDGYMPGTRKQQEFGQHQKAWTEFDCWQGQWTENHFCHPDWWTKTSVEQCRV